MCQDAVAACAAPKYGCRTCCAFLDNNAEPTFCGPAVLRALPLCFPIPPATARSSRSRWVLIHRGQHTLYVEIPSAIVLCVVWLPQKTATKNSTLVSFACSQGKFGPDSSDRCRAHLQAHNRLITSALLPVSRRATRNEVSSRRQPADRLLN